MIEIGAVVRGKIEGRRGIFRITGASGKLRLKNVRITANGPTLQQIKGRWKKTEVVIEGFNPSVKGCGMAYRHPKKKSS